MRESLNPIAPAEGKLSILIPGLGAVAITFIAGVLAVRKNGTQPIGSLTQMSNIRLGKRIGSMLNVGLHLDGIKAQRRPTRDSGYAPARPLQHAVSQILLQGRVR